MHTGSGSGGVHVGMHECRETNAKRMKTNEDDDGIFKDAIAMPRVELPHGALTQWHDGQMISRAGGPTFTNPPTRSTEPAHEDPSTSIGYNTPVPGNSVNTALALHTPGNMGGLGQPAEAVYLSQVNNRYRKGIYVKICVPSEEVLGKKFVVDVKRGKPTCNIDGKLFSFFPIDLELVSPKKGDKCIIINKDNNQVGYSGILDSFDGQIAIVTMEGGTKERVPKSHLACLKDE